MCKSDVFVLFRLTGLGVASGSMKNVVCEGVNPTRYKHVGWGASGAPR